MLKVTGGMGVDLAVVFLSSARSAGGSVPPTPGPGKAKIAEDVSSAVEKGLGVTTVSLDASAVVGEEVVFGDSSISPGIGVGVRVGGGRGVKVGVGVLVGGGREGVGVGVNSGSRGARWSGEPDSTIKRGAPPIKQLGLLLQSAPGSRTP